LTDARPDSLEATRTRLSRVDGQAGELVIGGFRLEDLAARASFEEVAFLLWNDRLPATDELHSLRLHLDQQRTLPPDAMAILQRANLAGAGSMDALRLAVESQALESNGSTPDNVAWWREQAVRIVARMPLLVAAYARLRAGADPVQPPPGLGHAAAYLFALRGAAADPAATRALETYFNTVVDHGLNADLRRPGRRQHALDLVAAVAAGLAALKGRCTAAPARP
jgi:citrate synthase